MTRLKKVIGTIHKVSDTFEKALICLCGACLVAGVLMMLAEVFTRYVKGISIFWAEEFVRYVNIWFIFLLVGPLAKRGYHLSMNALQDRFPQEIRKIFTVAFTVLNIAVFIFLVLWGIDLTRLMIVMGVKSMTGSILHPWTWRITIPVSMSIAVLFLFEYLVSYLMGEDL